MSSKWLMACQDSRDADAIVRYFREKRGGRSDIKTVYCLSDEAAERLSKEGFKVVREADLEQGNVPGELDDVAYQFACGWHRQTVVHRALLYRDVPIGVVFEKDLIRYFICVIKRFFLIEKLIRKETPQNLLRISKKTTVSPAVGEQGEHELQEILAILGDTKKIQVWNTASAGEEVLFRTHRPSAAILIKQAVRGLSDGFARSIVNRFISISSDSPAREVLISSDMTHARNVLDRLVSRGKYRMLYFRENFGPRLSWEFWTKKVLFLTETDFKSEKLLNPLPEYDWKAISADLERYLVFQDISIWRVVEAKIRGLFERERPSAAKRIDAFYTMFSQRNIGAVLVDEDVCEFNKALVLVAKRFNIYTLVIQHGMTTLQVGFSPLSADAMAVWGDYSKKRMVDWGADKSRLIVTGPPRYDVFLNSHWNKRQAREVGPLLLATQPFREGIRPAVARVHSSKSVNEWLIRGTLQALQENPGLRLVIKLHPRDRNVPFTQQILGQFPGLRARVKVLQHADTFDLLRKASIVLSTWSSIFTEAVIFQKPVIVVDALEGDLLLREFENSMFRFAVNEGELRQHLRRFISSLGQFSFDKEQRDLLQHLVTPTDGHAADRICDIIESHA